MYTTLKSFFQKHEGLTAVGSVILGGFVYAYLGNVIMLGGLVWAVVSLIGAAVEIKKK